MLKKFSVPRGTADILPSSISYWQGVEQKARQILETYRFMEIRTPIFEETALFTRSLGQTSDVVQKQMLTLSSQKEDSFSLRPEGTASIARAYIENDIDKKQKLAKFYYIGPMFRGERPQKGRLRQFHHIGVEAIGVSQPLLDAEIISLSVRLLSEFGIKGFKLKINSLGSLEDKKNLSILLRDDLKKNLSALCEDCQNRFERNVFRILDCKNENCKKVVHGLHIKDSHLSEESRKYFENVREALDLLKISYEVNPLLVRGLDYYTHTVFELSHESLGSQDALGAGGRYDHLMEELGGPNVGAVGFALGVERILLAKPGTESPVESSLDVFVVTRGEEAVKKAFVLLNTIRSHSIMADMSYEPDSSFKSQMRLADKLKSKYVLLLGEDELKENVVTVKDMKSGEQQKVSFEKIGEVIKNKICSHPEVN